MKNLSHHLAALAVTAWAGSLWAIGYLAVPVLFHAQPDRQLAGMLSGEVLVRVGYLGMVCGSYLLIHRISIFGKIAFRQMPFWVIVSMLLITLILQFGLQPAMSNLKTHDLSDVVYAERFRMLHGVSSLAYLIESLLGAILVLKTRSESARINDI